MEKIIIKNFLVFDDIEMEINKFNILIGPQASGKSLLAKLVYYFKGIGSVITDCIKNDEGLEEVHKILEREFVVIFPKEYWKIDNDFYINYVHDNMLVEIIKKSNNNNLKINLNFEFEKFYTETKEEIKNYKINLLSQNSITLGKTLFLDKYFTENVMKSNYSKQFANIFFIPASRSFFSSLSNNMWTFFDKIDIDPMMVNFGKAFERAKFVYSMVYEEGSKAPDLNVSNIDKKINYTKKVIKGSYSEIDGKDWIIGDNYKVKLSRASSGQQESFPMLMVLMLNTVERKNIGDYFFIEEPEAHLFPDAQNTMLSLISMLKHEMNTGFFITTHSPYILSAINNAILANEVIKKNNLTIEKYISLSDGAYPIDFEEISAFAVNNGAITDIKDYEYKMIGSEVIDSVSDLFQDIMNQLLLLDD